ncbi:PC-esterase domain-containing protein 1B-like [Sciurus carolinensis]|uniref:PC-esterase domain-containing protein 1B-like n=1 Tax=Sciurus carolinensis TaxID=30640 RepID=UPI001FB1F4E2|nr:PC-esterase domain-containing protein 1B-like [Sciurus carolinensis]
MAHLRACEVRQLLHNKFVVVMGDSIQRAVYKDLVLLLQKDCLLSSSQLKTKGELSFEHDELLEGGRWGRMHNSTHYREVRQFCSSHHLVRFYFLTRAYSPYFEDILAELRWGEHAPDVVVMNSCVWDLSRYGRDFPRSYREDLGNLFRRLDQVLPQSCLLVWNTAMPVAEIVSGVFLAPEGETCRTSLREDVMEANFYSSAEAARRGFDVLDLHFHFRHAGQHRQRDGVHWDERAHRHLSQLLLAHVADAWGVDLPSHHLGGRWIRDDPSPAGRRAGPAGRRQPQDNRGDPRESAFSWSPPTPPCFRTPWRPSVPSPQAQTRFLHYQHSTRFSSYPPSQRQRFSDSSARQIRYTREAHTMVAREPRLGPIRRASTQRPGRASPPYPPRHPSGPHGRQGRRSERRVQAHP